MLEKARQGKHGRHPTILSRWYADEEYRKPLSAIGWKEHHIMLYDRIVVDKHIYIATRVERIQNSKHWILTVNAEASSKYSINDPTLLKRTENANDCTTSTWQGQKKNTGPFLAVNKFDKEKNNRSKESKNSTTRLTLKQAGGSTKSRGETCQQLRHRIGTKPSGGRAIGILSILQALTSVKIFLRVRTGFGCLEKNLQPTDGECEQYTHKYSTYRVAQHDHISSREHAWVKSLKAQDYTSLCPSNNCHPRT